MISRITKFFLLFIFLCPSTYATEPTKPIPPIKYLSHSKWTNYINKDYKFKISFPALLTLSTKTNEYSTVMYNSTPWSFDSKNNGQSVALIPVLALHDLPYYPGSYLAAVHIGVSKDADAVRNCFICDNGDEQSPIEINHISFHVCLTSDAGAGSAVNVTKYRTVYNNQCYSIEQISSGPTSHGAFDENPNDIPDKTLGDYDTLAETIIKTFAFIKG